MKKLFAICKRELLALFYSPVAYITSMVFLCMVGTKFFLSLLGNEGEFPERMEQLFYETVLLWGSVLITVVCMRSFNEEKRTSALDLLLSAPVTEFQIVIGKFIANFIFIIFNFLLSAFILILSYYTVPGIKGYYIGGLIGGGIVVMVITAVCVAWGGMISLFAPNQAVAGIIIFCCVWIILLGGWILQQIPPLERYKDIIVDFSVTDQLALFCLGIFDSLPLIFWLAVAFAGLFMTVHYLEVRRL